MRHAGVKGRWDERSIIWREADRRLSPKTGLGVRIVVVGAKEEEKDEEN